MDTDRRSLLSTLGKGLAAAATMTVVSTPAMARQRKKQPSDAAGLLYDSTKCVGCQSCSVACKKANNLPADTTSYGGGLYDAPLSLNERTKSVIQLYKDDKQFAFVKKQCMHCVDPACVGACMLGAMHKGKFGIVEWDASLCVGCRYCQMACPFNVAKFEWTKALPKIVKCELCKDRLAEGKQPACTEVCPRQAVIYGKYTDLLDEAHRRLAAEPHKYVQKVYGEKDLGGTQVLYLSNLEFEKLGFRFDKETPIPEVQQTVQHGIYKGFVAPGARYALLGAVMFRNRRQGTAASAPPPDGRRDGASPAGGDAGVPHREEGQQ
jgi:Fe-S-cluster-containing dehydrogenase component